MLFESKFGPRRYLTSQNLYINCTVIIVIDSLVSITIHTIQEDVVNELTKRRLQVDNVTYINCIKIHCAIVRCDLMHY
jgi:hypothetical protein